MPEYRRFISYFYEYIDGKKQKNAGFAKVELRNGMWRILIRINAEPCPQSPIQVYGFVRETDRQRGILLGEIRPVQQIAEEWAFRADAPIGEEPRTLGDLAGIWIESGDGRRFITVWDDEGIDVERFTTEASRELAYAEDGSEPVGLQEAEENPQQAEESPATIGAQPIRKSKGQQTESDGTEPGEISSDHMPDMAEEPQAADAPKSLDAAETWNAAETRNAGAGAPEMMGAQEVSEEEGVGPEETECPEEKIEKNESMAAEKNPQEDSADTAGAGQPGTAEDGQKSRAGKVIEELLQKRAAFRPFDDEEIESCVMILPCDIVRLQQENWKVGRSSFLQHGFHQYRHLLLEKDRKGAYILGVPGIRNPQETYMAQMFGYDRFRESARRNTNQTFGYWCRELRQD